MSTPYEKIYDAFLAKVNDDDWSDPSMIEVHEEDWKAILHSAMPFFKFPRFNTTLDDDLNEVEGDMTQEEIEIVANLMKAEWISRIINSWDQVKTMYDERDFSQANMLSQLTKVEAATNEKCRKLQKNYSRSINNNGMKSSFDYSIFGGSNK